MKRRTKILVDRLNSYYDIHKFYNLPVRGDCALTFYMVRKHVTNHITFRVSHIGISGVCASVQIYDSNALFLGLLFESPKKNTIVKPFMLSIKIPPEQEEYKEVMLPPKYDVLAYTSDNSSTLVIAQAELDFQYIVKDLN